MVESEATWGLLNHAASERTCYAGKITKWSCLTCKPHAVRVGVSRGINILASQASQLRKRVGKRCLLDDAAIPHPRGGARTNRGDCRHHSTRGQQIARALWTLVRLVDGHRGAHWYRPRRGAALLVRDRKPYEICGLHHAQHLSGTPGLSVRGSVYPLHLARGHATACIPWAVEWGG
ncbi:MAG: hypothetical protein JOZ78_15525 [Chroococcidiopsidaceae cyanobacterium CP_BM_ER_R8_30]|nr:hypothetical protein [Chroococcidiopsidaceae cyanobacterium CP_BM_ER_R8_30]